MVSEGRHSHRKAGMAAEATGFWPTSEGFSLPGTAPEADRVEPEAEPGFNL